MRLRCTLALVFALLTLGTPAGATHSWEDYHWPRTANPFSIPLVDSMTGEWVTPVSYLPLVSVDWSRSSVLDTVRQPGATDYASRFLCDPIEGKIRACNAENPDVTWLGLATIWIDGPLLRPGNHIVMATAQMNDFWFDTALYDDPNARRHVLCQEVGHTFGLDHQYTEPSCMDDTNGLDDPAYSTPGGHDYAQLEAIYTSHVDVSKGGGNKGGGNKGGGNKGGGKKGGGGSGGNGKGSGKPHEREDGYHGSSQHHHPGHTEVHVSQEDALTVVRYIVWAR